MFLLCVILLLIKQRLFEISSLLYNEIFIAQDRFMHKIQFRQWYNNTFRLKVSMWLLNFFIEEKKYFGTMYFSDGIEATLTTSRYGKPVLLLGSHRYNKSSRYRGSRVMWYCSRNRQGCKASVLTLDQIIVRVNENHNHIWFCYLYFSKKVLNHRIDIVFFSQWFKWVFLYFVLILYFW